MFGSVDAAAEGLRAQGYFVGREVATQVYLAGRLGKPLLVQGPPGSGRAGLARAVAAATGRPLTVLTCHEGITPGEAAGELERSAEVASDGSPMVLVRDVDAAPAQFQVWLAGMVAVGSGATTWFLTAAGGDGLHPDLLRSAIAISLSFPVFEAEVEILLHGVPGISRALAAEVANFAGRLRQQPLRRLPGVAETLDWARALVALGAHRLTPAIVDQTAGCLLKDARDLDTFHGARMAALLGGRIDRSG